MSNQERNENESDDCQPVYKGFVRESDTILMTRKHISGFSGDYDASRWCKGPCDGTVVITDQLIQILKGACCRDKIPTTRTASITFNDLSEISFDMHLKAAWNISAANSLFAKQTGPLADNSGTLTIEIGVGFIVVTEKECNNYSIKITGLYESGNYNFLKINFEPSKCSNKCKECLCEKPIVEISNYVATYHGCPEFGIYPEQIVCSLYDGCAPETKKDSSCGCIKVPELNECGNETIKSVEFNFHDDFVVDSVRIDLIGVKSIEATDPTTAGNVITKIKLALVHGTDGVVLFNNVDSDGALNGSYSFVADGSKNPLQTANEAPLVGPMNCNPLCVSLPRNRADVNICPEHCDKTITALGSNPLTVFGGHNSCGKWTLYVVFDSPTPNDEDSFSIKKATLHLTPRESGQLLVKDNDCCEFYPVARSGFHGFSAEAYVPEVEDADTATPFQPEHVVRNFVEYPIPAVGVPTTAADGKVPRIVTITDYLADDNYNFDRSDGKFSLKDGVYTVPESGIYEISYNILVDGTGATVGIPTELVSIVPPVWSDLPLTSISDPNFGLGLIVDKQLVEKYHTYVPAQSKSNTTVVRKSLKCGQQVSLGLKYLHNTNTANTNLRAVSYLSIVKL